MVEEFGELVVEGAGLAELGAEGLVDLGELVGEGAQGRRRGGGGDVAAGGEVVVLGGDVGEGDAAGEAGHVGVGEA